MKKLFLLFLAVPILIGSGCTAVQNNQQNYGECLKACADNNTCVERMPSQDSNPRGGGCSRYSEGDCKNICIQKYK